MNESIENVIALSESSLENVSDINTYGQALNSIWIWIALLTIVVSLWRLPKLKGWLLQKKILQLAEFTVIFSVLGMCLCLLMYLASIYIPNAELFLVDKDGRFNLTFISAIVAGIVFLARQEEEERKRKYELLSSFHNELLEAGTEYIYVVDTVVYNFFKLNRDLALKISLAEQRLELQSEYNANVEDGMRYLPSYQQDDYFDPLTEEYEQRKRDNLRRGEILVDFKGLREFMDLHRNQCKYISEEFNKKHARLKIILKTGKDSKGVGASCEALYEQLNRIRTDYDRELREVYVSKKLTVQYTKLKDELEEKIKDKQTDLESRLSNLINDIGASL